jgi:xanthine dehydrogenase accessory factor
MALDWLAAGVLEHEAVLVTVASASGSVPRDAGAKMLVTQTAQFDTIGGGHLELKAADIARTLLAQAGGGATSGTAPPPAGAPVLQRMALGPSLGQCCGGVVHLLFEVITPARRAHLRLLQQRLLARQDSWRVVALDAACAGWVLDADGGTLPAPDLAADLQKPASLPPLANASCHMVQDASGQRYLLDPCPAWRARLFLFGAGHVASHLVHALAHLPCFVTWVDERAELFPPQVSANVQIEVSDLATSLIRQAPSGCAFLVMTHSHSLDQDLVEAVLQRDSLWLGLIGSHSKRAQFESRLRQRGMAEQRLAHMVSPIGVPGITSKLPAVIAASVCAQLLQVWQQAGQLDSGTACAP